MRVHHSCPYFHTEKGRKGTVKIRSNGPAYNGIPPITEKYLSPFIIFYSYLYIGYNRNLPITDELAWSLKIR